MTAARYLNIAPWELEEREDCDFWMLRAVQFKSAETLAKQIAAELQAKRNEFNK